MDQPDPNQPAIDTNLPGTLPPPEPVSPQPAAPQSLITPEQKNNLFSELGLQEISEEQKENLMNQMIDTVLNRIFNRILNALSKKDVEMLNDLQMKPDSDETVIRYLITKVPSLNEIAQEEIESFRSEVKDTILTIKSNLPNLNLS